MKSCGKGATGVDGDPLPAVRWDTLTAPRAQPGTAPERYQATTAPRARSALRGAPGTAAGELPPVGGTRTCSRSPQLPSQRPGPPHSSAAPPAPAAGTARPPAPLPRAAPSRAAGSRAHTSPSEKAALPRFIYPAKNSLPPGSPIRRGRISNRANGGSRHGRARSRQEEPRCLPGGDWAALTSLARGARSAWRRLGRGGRRRNGITRGGGGRGGRGRRRGRAEL